MTIYIQQLMKQLTDLCDRFGTLVWSEGDAAAAAALVDPNGEVRNLPLGYGGAGREDVHRFLAGDVVPHRPADLQVKRISQTGDRWRVAEELVVTFTHDRELPWLLPGVIPSGRHAEVSAMSIVEVRRSLIVSHRTLWDLHGLCAQVGADPRLPES